MSGCCADKVCTPGTCMGLPPGKTCGQCVRFTNCRDLFGCAPSNRSCDWFPRRFVEILPVVGIAGAGLGDGDEGCRKAGRGDRHGSAAWGRCIERSVSNDKRTPGPIESFVAVGNPAAAPGFRFFDELFAAHDAGQREAEAEATSAKPVPVGQALEALDGKKKRRDIVKFIGLGESPGPGVVESAGPVTYLVRWASGRRTRVTQDYRYVIVETSPAALVEARKALGLDATPAPAKRAEPPVVVHRPDLDRPPPVPAGELPAAPAPPERITLEDFIAECGPGGEMRDTTTADLLTAASEWADCVDGDAGRRGVEILQRAAREMAAIEKELV